MEAILRIAYYKKDNSEQAGNPEGFKNTLEAMFADAELDIKKKAKNDQVLHTFIELSNQGFFEENFDLLAALFNEKGMPKSDGFVEISKADLVNVFKDSKIIIIPQQSKDKDDKKKQQQNNQPNESQKKEEDNKEPQQKFDEQDVRDAIQSS